ncbi:hypothetical protein P43SY_011136 [Pythium insidiosum]|uniref:RING-type domain-containing protein n=1 Tax=Pythium insidiosum TaxID=114742 RepID=A0AAD5L9Z0_PYTIN|nr:hypothetical protein P43SY_011136 [Pythium insidiosum]
MSASDVFLRCVKQGGRLRVRIISPGYYAQANCQFPRAIRREGRVFAVPPSSIRLTSSAGGTNFYRVSQPIRIVQEAPGDEVEATGPAAVVEGNAAAPKATARKRQTKKRARPAEVPLKVFDIEDEPECVACLEAPKQRICVPCGHFCLCERCLSLLIIPKKCPLCRTPIKSTISPAELS